MHRFLDNALAPGGLMESAQASTGDGLGILASRQPAAPRSVEHDAVARGNVINKPKTMKLRTYIYGRNTIIMRKENLRIRQVFGFQRLENTAANGGR